MKENYLPDYHSSIFYQLFEYASDLESKLILLDQILEVGDRKEIPLLNKLEKDSNSILRIKAKKIKELLVEKLEIESRPEHKKLPINLCFLYNEFDISPPKESLDSDINFNIALDIYIENNKLK